MAGYPGSTTKLEGQEKNNIFAKKKMSPDGYRLLLPSGFTDYFDILKVDESSSQIIIYLEEKLILTNQTKDTRLESKGFHPSAVIRDFPVRGKPLLLNIRRRRWIEKDSGRYISRPIQIQADGTHMTQEFASFLKGLCR